MTSHQIMEGQSVSWKDSLEMNCLAHFKYKEHSSTKEVPGSRGPTGKGDNHKGSQDWTSFTPESIYSRLRIYHMAYYSHEYTVGSDHSSIQMEICIGNSEVRRLAFKWNIGHMKGEISNWLKEIWTSFPAQASFFYKLRVVSKLFR